MSGEKIDQSKEAIIKVIENLSTEDQIHFVIYDNIAEVVFENGDLKNKEYLIEQVKKVICRFRSE